MPVPKTLNLIKNPSFAEGKKKPLRWSFASSSESIRFERPESEDGVRLRTDVAVGTAMLSQTVVCKPKEYYRVEAVASCDLTADATNAGFVLRVQPVNQNGDPGRMLTTTYLKRTYVPTTMRGCVEIPDGVRRLRVEIGIVGATGSVTVHRVAMLGIIEPEEGSHVLALPAPSIALPAPKTAKTVSVCSATAASRPLTAILGAVMGIRQVSGKMHLLNRQAKSTKRD